MIEVPPGARTALKNGVMPLVFVQFTVDKKTWRYVNADQDVEVDGIVWTGISTIEAHHHRDDLQPSFLTPIERATKERTLGTQNPIVGVRGHWRVMLTGLEGSWQHWHGLVGFTEFYIVMRRRVMYGRNQWFTLETHEGNVVDTVLHRTERGDWKVEVFSVDRLMHDTWAKEGHPINDVVRLCEQMESVLCQEVIGFDGYAMIVVQDGKEGTVYVVCRSRDRNKVRRYAYRLMRALNRHAGRHPARLYKYMLKKHAERLLKGHAYISPASRFEEQADLAKGQKDSELVKETKVGVSSLVRFSAVDHGSSSFAKTDDGTGKFTLASEPYWIWCCSVAFSLDLLSEFNADTIVEITDVNDFVRRLLDEGSKGIESTRSWAGCVDYESHQDYLYFGRAKMSVSHPSMMKHRKYEHQQEFRVGWWVDGSSMARAHEVHMGSNSHCARIVYSSPSLWKRMRRKMLMFVMKRLDDAE